MYTVKKAERAGGDVVLGYYIMVISDDEVKVMRRKQQLGELTVMLMNIPEEIMSEFFELDMALVRSPLIHRCRYPFISCNPPIMKHLAPRRQATVDDLKQTDKLLRKTLEILQKTDIGSVLFGDLSIEQIDEQGLLDAGYLSDEYMRYLASYQSLFNLIYMAVYDIRAMHECFYELELFMSDGYNSMSASTS